jgi:hypothetical protein
MDTYKSFVIKYLAGFAGKTLRKQLIANVLANGQYIAISRFASASG